MMIWKLLGRKLCLSEEASLFQICQVFPEPVHKYIQRGKTFGQDSLQGCQINCVQKCEISAGNFWIESLGFFQLENSSENWELHCTPQQWLENEYAEENPGHEIKKECLSWELWADHQDDWLPLQHLDAHHLLSLGCLRTPNTSRFLYLIWEKLLYNNWTICLCSK